MNSEISNATQIRFNSYLLPSLGELIPGPKNVLSPFGLRFDQQAAPGEIAATGLLDSQGSLQARYQPLLAVLANPSSLVDLRFATGGHLQQFSLYFSQPDTLPIMLMNTIEGLLLEYPADTKAIVDGLMHFSSDSVFVSFDLDFTLPYESALALVALVDLHRREVARSFANLTPLGTISVNADEIANWIARCPEDPQWITTLMPQEEPGRYHSENVLSYLNYLVEHDICQTAGEGYALAGPALTLGNRVILIDNLYSLDIARVNAGGQVGFASITALQAGINDLLQIEFMGDEVSFKSLSPIEFILQIEHFLEKGGKVLPDLPGESEAKKPPVEKVTPANLWRLAVPGLVTPFPLAEAITIGRADDCNLKLDDLKASRQHARIERRQDGFWIIDLDSSNGVFVNNNQIMEPAQLVIGDQIQIGDTMIVVLAEPSVMKEDATITGMKPPTTPPQSHSQSQSFAKDKAQSASTCSQCDQPLSPTARFCGRCGKPVSQPASQPNPSPPTIQPSTPVPQPVAAQSIKAQQSEEMIVTALPMGNQRSGFLGVGAKSYILVLTNQRILLAEQTSEIMKENARQAKEAAKQSGKGFFGQWGAVMGSSASQRYLQMHPQSILNETVGNYFIANNQVRSVHIKENHDPDTARSEVKLTLDTVSGKVEFIYTQSNKKEIKQALQQTLGNLVR